MEEFAEWLREEYEGWKDEQRNEYNGERADRWQEFLASAEITEAWERFEATAWQNRLDGWPEEQLRLREEWKRERA